MSRFPVAFAVLLSSSTAFAQALDCAGRDAEVCQAVNELVPSVNAQAGAVLLSASSSRAAFRPTSLYASLLQVKAAATAGGCAVEGWSAGLYDANAGVESWDGALDDFAGAPEVSSGIVTLDPSIWMGTTATRDIGFDVGVHNAAGQIAADIDDDGFKAGLWHRRSGSRGLFVALTGTCVGVDGGDALDPWFIGDLPPFAPESPGEFLVNGGECGHTVNITANAAPSIVLAECFSSSLPGPLTLDSVTLPVNGLHDGLVEIGIHTWSGGPGGPDLVGNSTFLHSVAPPPAVNTLGTHVVEVGLPVPSAFCVVLTHNDANDGNARTHTYISDSNGTLGTPGVTFVAVPSRNQQIDLGIVNNLNTCVGANVSSAP